MLSTKYLGSITQRAPGFPAEQERSEGAPDFSLWRIAALLSMWSFACWQPLAVCQLLYGQLGSFREQNGRKNWFIYIQILNVKLIIIFKEIPHILKNCLLRRLLVRSSQISVHALSLLMLLRVWRHFGHFCSPNWHLLFFQLCILQLMDVEQWLKSGSSSIKLVLKIIMLTNSEECCKDKFWA